MSRKKILIVCKPRNALERSDGSHVEHEQTLSKINEWKKKRDATFLISIASLDQAARAGGFTLVKHIETPFPDQLPWDLAGQVGASHIDGNQVICRINDIY